MLCSLRVEDKNAWRNERKKNFNNKLWIRFIKLYTIPVDVYKCNYVSENEQHMSEAS